MKIQTTLQTDLSLIWFRADLRIEDNAALAAAAQSQRPCVAFFVLPTNVTNLPKGQLPSSRPLYGRASRWWLDQSLVRLEKELKSLNIPLIIFEGEEHEVVVRCARHFGTALFFWNRRYDPAGVACDTDLKSQLKATNQMGGSYKGNLIKEPWEVTNGSGEPYKVFTPFWKALQKLTLDSLVAQDYSKFKTDSEQIKVFDFFQKTDAHYTNIAPPSMRGKRLSDAVGASPTRQKWTVPLHDFWQSQDANPQTILDSFLKQKLSRYREDRNTPSLTSTSILSPYLRFGEISPLQICDAVFRYYKVSRFSDLSDSALFFLSEVCWREFSHTILFYHKDISQFPIKSAFVDFPWDQNQDHFKLWTQGNTGYPLVDAGMHELWNTGIMHNRVRMVVASFLVKHLLLPWTWGEAWFWDTLVDACPANNAAGWQWVAGCGLDAAPYFRIFNPISQSEKFDPKGLYIKKWLPQLAKLGDKEIHSPWLAPPKVLLAAGVQLGQNYPLPIVDHATARVKALDGYQKIRGTRVTQDD